MSQSDYIGSLLFSHDLIEMATCIVNVTLQCEREMKDSYSIEPTERPPRMDIGVYGTWE